jgi:glucose/arabinose dehydrogenase
MKKANVILLIVLLMAGFTMAETLKGKAAFGSWRDDRPGLRRLITPQDEPPVNKPGYGLPDVVPMPAGASLHVPQGFAVQLLTKEIRKPRVIRVAPNGDLFVAESVANAVHVLRLDATGTKVSKHEVYLDGLHQPYGIAFYPEGPNPQWIYIANSNSVIRVPYQNGDLKARAKPVTLVENIPSSHHWGRDIVFSSDGQQMFVGVGSGSNVAEGMSAEPHHSNYPQPHDVKGLSEWIKTKPLGATWGSEEIRADVLSFDINGENMQIFATGLRNCQGLARQPATKQLWCVVNERDLLGDNTPFDYATHVEQGAFYGWPWYFIGGHEDPRHAGERPDLKNKVTLPDVLIQAHSAPLQITFYSADSFPPEYKETAFVALHGSWNRTERTGYKVVRLLFDRNGKPTGEYEDFLTGFVISDKQVWGRPVGVAVARDGSLLVTDDGNGTIWRISYTGK